MKIRSLWKAFIDWDFVPATDEQMQGAQLIVTQAWSRCKDQSPGAGNILLAKVADDLSAKTGLKVFPQEEVAGALSHKTPVAGIAGGSKDGASTLEWNTESVAKLQIEYCHEHKLTRVIVIAHPSHMNRALGVYRELGLLAIAAPVPRKWAPYQDPDLIHWWFRYRWMIPIAWARELLARVLFALNGKI